MINDVVGNVLKLSDYKPDNMEKIKAFTNTYIAQLSHIYGFKEIRDKIVYLSGPVTNVSDHKERFDEMECAVYKLFSAYNIYVINPLKVFKLAEPYNFSYMDKIIICYSLISISNVLIFDNRDNKFESSVGTFAELSYAIGKGIQTIDYNRVVFMNKEKDYLVSDYVAKNIEKYNDSETKPSSGLDNTTFDSFGKIINI